MTFFSSSTTWAPGGFTRNICDTGLMGDFELQFVGQRFQPPAPGTGRTAVMDSGRACVSAVEPGACVDPAQSRRLAGFSSRAAHSHHPLLGKTDGVASDAARRCSFVVRLDWHPRCRRLVITSLTAFIGRFEMGIYPAWHTAILCSFRSSFVSSRPCSPALLKNFGFPCPS